MTKTLSATTGLEVFAELRQRILTGSHRPRQRLKEEQLAREFGVSRTPIRHALTMLEAEGLVELIPNRGAIVCGYSVDDVLQIYDLRALLEGHAARLAAASVTRNELEEMAAVARGMEAFDAKAFGSHEDAVRSITTQNQRFHQSIVHASRNAHLEKLIRRTVQTPLVYKSFYGYTRREFDLSNNYHGKILQALERKDGGLAETLMREHVLCGRDFVVQALRAEGVV